MAPVQGVELEHAGLVVQQKKYAVVTTFSKQGYEEYGKKFLETYLTYWRGISLHVYWEGNDFPKIEGVTWHNLDDDQDRAAFIARHPGKEKDYRTAAKRFCHKIFALTDPERLKLDVETWIWLDADVETFAKVDEAFLESVCPAGFVGSYLGRCDWPHSECGFVSYAGVAGRDALAQFREWYATDRIFDYPETHDSFIFDRLREETGGWWYDISAGRGGMHVWDESPLAEKMRHLKGPLRKQGQLAPVSGYASPKEIAAMKKNSVARVGNQDLIIKTKNCVPDPNIQANIHYSATLGRRWIQQCDMDLDSTIVFCSGGPSLKDFLPEIKKLSRKKNHHIVCVKTAHDILIENKIVPWACILLDPRAHVQDFIENPHSKVLYFTASMCHPTTWDKLLEKEAQVFGYHAMVGAGEQDVLKTRFKSQTMMLGGGCSAAMRGVSVLHALGFRRFKMYGYDCSFFEEPDWTAKTKSGEPKFLEVEVLGRKFWTDPEKVAQCQDFLKMMENNKDLELEVFGPGMVPFIWNQKKNLQPKFLDLLNAEQNSANIDRHTSETKAA